MNIKNNVYGGNIKMKSKKYTYIFNEGNAFMSNLLGGKGANLAEMTNLGIPVPPGFTITTEACNNYYENDMRFSRDIIEQVDEMMIKLERKTGKKFGSMDNPLFVSVRSGARVSMPGIMDTILNLGLNDETVEGLHRLSNDEKFAYDSYRRFIQTYSEVVMGMEKERFESIFNEVKDDKKVKYDDQLTAEDLKGIVNKYKDLYRIETKNDFPQNPREQLFKAISAIFKSWNNERTVSYRRLNNIPEKWGTAVNIQLMVFGNMGKDSGTGVAFTRNPITGENSLFGEYLVNAQGEDVVSGIRTPSAISKLKEQLPECYNQFIRISRKLEEHYGDMQDLEFTIEQGKLYFLQTRDGKRTSQAALKIAADLINEAIITKEEALTRVDKDKLESLLCLGTRYKRLNGIDFKLKELTI